VPAVGNPDASSSRKRRRPLARLSADRTSCLMNHRAYFAEPHLHVA
jgi:hypothetical protein